MEIGAILIVVVFWVLGLLLTGWMFERAGHKFFVGALVALVLSPALGILIALVLLLLRGADRRQRST